MEHYARLYGRVSPWGRDHQPAKVYCKDVHRQPCKSCKTCHFCRQKTIDPKTSCACVNMRGSIVGGKARGHWCGSCLEMRMGENLEEVLQQPGWRCPVCRDVCNCSGANCIRSRRNLFPTNQLIHEATRLGYQSVRICTCPTATRI